MGRRYYKWMMSDDPVMNRIPGFVFLSLKDAIKYQYEYDDWIYNSNIKNLYTFVGVNPIPIKQMLVSKFGHRTPSYNVTSLNNLELSNALYYFSTKPSDWFTFTEGEKDIELMLSIGRTVGCIKPVDIHVQYVYDIEALYCLPIKMIKVTHQNIIAKYLD
jgi:hypothetical protein